LSRRRRREAARHERHTAYHFLEGLVDPGVDYIFANLGTDHVSLIEEIARWDKEGRKHPEMILCPHEVVAVHMAGGYALATERAQAVFVHVGAGTANACMAIQNLFRYQNRYSILIPAPSITLRQRSSSPRTYRSSSSGGRAIMTRPSFTPSLLKASD
jgi:Thiamine pyrophosphate enzyme, N-terminal TPP binding domain